ncbi:MAG: DUF465 domain-containing protein [Alphaproteobacteria bacterium]|jgi:hypothetical protein|nr:DUF465 domain-containing protein [Alphaproteobacteria bacterium]|tara:strand:- start:188 stop:358 length:171 start_codon:yes stop_codon:yes gene_type:complete
MSAETEIEQLRKRHQALKSEIEEENQRPHPDDLKITALKKQKLKLKDEILQLEASA